MLGLKGGRLFVPLFFLPIRHFIPLFRSRCCYLSHAHPRLHQTRSLGIHEQQISGSSLLRAVGVFVEGLLGLVLLPFGNGLLMLLVIGRLHIFLAALLVGHFCLLCSIVVRLLGSFGKISPCLAHGLTNLTDGTIGVLLHITGPVLPSPQKISGKWAFGGVLISRLLGTSHHLVGCNLE